MCDLVLEAWEAWLAADARRARAPVDGWLALLRGIARPDAPAQLLGFRFLWHQAPGSPPAPPALFRLAAQLVGAGVAPLEAVLAYLGPDDDALAARFAAAAEAVRAEAAAFGQIDLTRAPPGAAAGGGAGGGALAAAGDPAAGGQPRASSLFIGGALELDAARFDDLLLRRLMAEPTAPAAAVAAGEGAGGGVDAAGKPSGAADSKANGGGGAAAAAAAGAAGDQQQRHHQPLQKLAMVEGLLACGNWPAARLLIRQLRLLGVPAAADRGVCAALCELAAARVDPIHDALLPEGPLGPSRLEAYLDAVERAQRQAATAGAGGAAAQPPQPQPPAPPLPADAFDALDALGPYLYRDAHLFARVLRVLRHHVASYCCHGAGRAAAAAAAAGESAVEGDGDDGGDGDGDGADAGLVPRVYRLLAGTVLPALAMLPANVAAANAAWAVLRLLPFPARFAVYHKATEVWARTPLLQGAAAAPVDAWKRVARRLHNPASERERHEVLNPYRLAVAKVAAAAPLQVRCFCRFDVVVCMCVCVSLSPTQPITAITLLPLSSNTTTANTTATSTFKHTNTTQHNKQIADAVVTYALTYESQIEPVVAALSAMGRLSLDALVYALLRYCGRYDRPKLKDDGNVAPTHSALAKFTGALCKRCPEAVDLGAIVQYVADSVKAGEALDLLLLNELLGQMTGIAVHTEVSQDQIDVLAMGPTARAESMQAQSAQRDAARGSDRALVRGGRQLMRALQRGPPGHQLALPLLVLVAQQLDYTAIAAPSRHLKLVADLSDGVLTTALTYLEFLRRSVPAADYAAMLPPLPALLGDYGVRLEVAMAAYRPVLRALEPRRGDGGVGGAAAAGAAAAEGGDGAAAGGAAAAPAAAAAAADGDAEMEEGEAEAPPGAAAGGGSGGALTPASAAGASVDNAAADDDGALAGAGAGALVVGGRTWPQLMADIAASLPGVVPDCLSPELLATFWGLTLPDVAFPAARYDGLVERLTRDVAAQEARHREARAEAEAARRQLDAIARSGGGGGAGGPGGGGWGHPGGGGAYGAGPGGGFYGGPGGGGRRGDERPDPAVELAKHEELMRQARAEVTRLRVSIGRQQGWRAASGVSVLGLATVMTA